jgi:hypothetical protein
MTHHEHEQHHQEHHHGHHHPTHKRRGIHKDWRAWVVVGLMLAAMAAYVLSDNERLGLGGGPPGQEMPAAPAAP